MRRSIRLRTACLAGLVVAAAVIAAASSGRRSGGDAVIHLPNREVDLGVVTFQEDREVTFTVTNRGRRRLVINELDSECGCSDSMRRTFLLRPGEKEDLVVSINTGCITGAIMKRTSFTTNDPGQPRFDLLITASVQSDRQP